MRALNFAALFLLCGAAFVGCRDKGDNKLVILHTNDTHSQIEPGYDGLGGVMRRMAVIDSIRAAEPNVMLVDAGDAVQGTLYFYLYGGAVEQEILNAMGVEARILGNHEFDNGIDSLAAVWSKSDAIKIASNYELEKSALAKQTIPYYIKEVGGKRIGFIGINLNPDGMIAKGNYDGLEFLPIIDTANALSHKLKSDDKVDAVIALTHIGYNPKGLLGDSILATNSHDIDVIIGGHSHDTIDPTTEEGARRSHLRNLDGETVLVVQTGKAGRNLGKIEINLDSLGLGAVPEYELIKIDSRYDDYRNEALEATINKYKAGVDSLMTMWIGTTEHALSNQEPELLNFFSDFILERGSELAPNVDLAISNKGGLRSGLPAGQFSKGQIINMVPFRNYITVIDIMGDNLKDAFEIMAMRDGDGVSANVSVLYEKDEDGADIDEIYINGRKIEKNRPYRVATIDYLSNGGDYMTPLTLGTVVAQSPNAVFDDLSNYFTSGKRRTLSSSAESRWKLK